METLTPPRSPQSSEKSEDHLKSIQSSVVNILSKVGENPLREGLLKTPERYAKSLLHMTSGYNVDPTDLLSKAVFHEDYDEMVIVKDIEFYSLCEHHLAPFFGRAHVGYIPKGKIVGLSKLARLVDIYARRLQVQERMTREIALAISKALEPVGVAVVLEASHLCMMMRGVEKENSRTVTSQMLGQFREDPKTREEFMRLIGR